MSGYILTKYKHNWRKSDKTATNLITLHNVQMQISSVYNLRSITYATVMTIVISLILEYDHKYMLVAVKVNAILISVISYYTFIACW